MKKFLIKVIIFLLIIVSIVFGLNYMYINSIYYENLLIGRGVLKYDDMPLEIDIMNFGSSHGRASFNYQDFTEYNTFNAGLSSQTILYDYAQLENFSERMTENSIAIFCISYCMLYVDNLDNHETFERLNKRYYDILDLENITNPDIEYYYLNKYCPILLLEEDEYIDAIKETELSVYNAKWYTDMSEWTEEYTARVLNQYNENHLKAIIEADYNIYDTVEKSILDIISLCEENDITPVFVTTPVYEDYYNLYEADIIDKIHEDFQKIIADSDVVYLDYADYDGISQNKYYFSDPDHLNEIGAREFTNIFLNDIDNLVGLP